MKKKKGLLNSLLVALAAIVFLTLTPSGAYASISGGSGGSGGGGAGNDNTGFPWTQISIQKWENGWAQPLVRGWWSGVDPNVCRDPRAKIFAKIDGSGRFGWSQTHAVGFGNLPATFQAWAGNREYVNVICGYDKERKTRTVTENKNGESNDARTAVYSWATSVAPQILVDGKDPIGANNLNAQSATAKSSFGQLYDSLNTGGGGGYEAKLRDIDNKINADKVKDHPDVNLNANNKAGLAEGGVLNINEHVMLATVRVSQTWTEQRSRTETCDVTAGTAWSNPTNCTYGNWSAWTEVPGSKTHRVSKVTPTQQNTGFWQILSVHCNPDELNALLAEVPTATRVAQIPGVNGNSTEVIYSQKYNGRPSRVDFGLDNTALPQGEKRVLYSKTWNSLKSRSGQLGFYDKECDLVCTASPDTALGASTANKATSNSGPTTSHIEKEFKGGALYENELNSNYIEVFRDNNARPVSLDVWYPAADDPQYIYGKTVPNKGTLTSGATVDVPASAPITTTITKWNEGTPSSAANSGGQFNMWAKSGTTKTKLFTGTGDPKTQKNWSKDTYSTENSVTLNGFYKDFDIAATWASDANKPQVLNVKWEYEPKVWTTFPGTVGFNSAGNIDQKNTTSELATVQGKCYAEYGTTTKTLDLLNKVQGSTGTGTTNTLDSSLVAGTSGDNSWTLSSNLVLKFIRAVSE